MATSGTDAPGVKQATVRQAPLQIFTGHKDQSYALDWSSGTPGRLLSGIPQLHVCQLYRNVP